MKHNENKRLSPGGGALLMVSAGILVKIIGALFKIPLSNLLGDRGFGYFSTAYDLFTPFYALAMGGLPVAAARLLAAKEATDRSGNIRQIRKVFGVAGLVLFGLFLGAIPLLQRWISPDGQSVFCYLAVAPSVPLFFIMAADRGIFEGQHEMKPTAVSDLIEAIGKLGLGLGAALLCKRLTENRAVWSAAALLGITVGVAAATLYLRLKAKPILKSATPDQSDKELLSLIWRPALTAVLISSAVGLVDVLTVTPLLQHAGQSAADAYGVRSKAYTLMNLVPAITTMLGISAVPSLAAAKAADDREAVQKNTVFLLKLTALVALPAGIGMATISRPIMVLLYGETASASLGAQLLRFYGIAAVFAGLLVPVIHALQALGHNKAALNVLLGGTAVKLLLNTVLIANRKIGILGAAVATAVGYGLIFAVGLSLLCTAVDFKKMPTLFFKPLLAAVGCGAVACVANSAHSKIVTAGVIGLAAVVYAGILCLLKPFSKAEWAMFRHKKCPEIEKMG